MTRVVEVIRIVDGFKDPQAIISVNGDRRAIPLPHRGSAEEVSDRDVVEAIARWLEGQEVSYAEVR